MPLPLLRHLLDPRYLVRTARRSGERIARRLKRLDEATVRLEPEGASRGLAAFSYIVDPLLTGAPDHSHTHFWESRQIARTLCERGFTVDALQWTNGDFAPDPGTDLLVDVRFNLERWAAALPDAHKVIHLDTCHHAFNNAAQARRRERLVQRRGALLPEVKTMPKTKGIEVCDEATYLGNEMTRESYAFADKPMTRIPVSVPATYEWLERDWEAVRRRFLWFGSGGLLHKGLDLVLEVFAQTPHLELLVCGPVDREREFERLYERELYHLPNVTTLGWVDVLAPSFLERMRGIGGLVYPSCAEGGGASVLTCMHAGVVPVLTREASVDLEPERGWLLPDDSLETLREHVERFAESPPDELEAQSRSAWEWSRAHHTRDVFAERYDAWAEGLLGRL
ncbi:MAG: glycosyltransferase [Acidobacteriota bacterium]